MKDKKINSKVKKREVANIELNWDNNEDLLNLVNNKQFYSFILEESLEAIVDALENNKGKAELFNIFNMSIVVEVKKTKFKSILLEVEKYFIENEEYEKCSELKKLITKYNL